MGDILIQKTERLKLRPLPQSVHPRNVYVQTFHVKTVCGVYRHFLLFVEHPGELEETICKAFGNDVLSSRTHRDFYCLLSGPRSFLLSKVTGRSPLPTAKVLHPPSCD